MANPEHLKILKSGIEMWNAWRSDALKVSPDLNWADLTRVDLSGADLTQANLRQASLIHADLSNATLRGADLGKANLVDAIRPSNEKEK